MSGLSLGEYKVRNLLKELGGKRGTGTELISVYIPSGRPLGEVSSVLRIEYSTASNIKDRRTRHHVLDALTTVSQRLKLFKATPPNGLVIFAGYVAGEAPGDETMEVHVLEPPNRLTTWLYRCDSRFHTEILEDMIAAEDLYGLITLDRQEAAFALLQGRRLEVVEEITSGIPGKHRAGGQSARRFARLIEQLANEFYKRVGEHANLIFLEKNIKGLIIGGPGPSKKEFVDGEFLHYTLKEKILEVYDIGYGGESGIYQLMQRSSEVLRNIAYVQEKEMINRFLSHLGNDTGLAAYGEKEVRKALQLGAVDTLLVSEGVRGYRISTKCPSCGEEVKMIGDDADSKFRCPNCGAGMGFQEPKTVVEELAEQAESTGAGFEIISTETDEGMEFLKTFGGVAAILRYKISA